jgi:hypothetical protein
MSIIMEGYDWGLQGNLWGMIEYRKVCRVVRSYRAVQ